MPDSTLSADHPGWETMAGGRPGRLVRHGSGFWLATWNARVELRPLQDGDAEPPRVQNVGAEQLPPRTPPGLTRNLLQLGQVSRLPNPWLWDAITTAVLRQGVRAAQAPAPYRRWCQTHGMSIANEDGKLALPPGPEATLALPATAFADVGVAAHRAKLQSAARAYLDHAATWARLTPADLADALEAVPGIGPWTARAAAADHTGDFSVYPHGDRAVRTRAARADPTHPWPAGGPAFASAWRALAEDPGQLSALTLLTLARAGHTRADS